MRKNKHNATLCRVAENRTLRTNKLDAIRSLKRLRDKAHKTTPAGLVARISFVSLVFRSRLYRELLDGDLFDQYHLSDRDFDTCFEMYDGSGVVAGVMSQAIDDGLLKAMLGQYLSKTTLDAWSTTFVTIRQKNTNTQASLF